MKITLPLCLAVFTLQLPLHAAEKYAIDPVHSTIGFKVKHLFSYVSGRFNEVGGTLEIDPEHPENASVAVTIQTKSIDTANAKRDTHLRSPDFFDAEKNPTITFTSKKVTKTGPETADVLGDLTMHGVTKDVTLKVTFLGKGKGMTGSLQTGWEATTTLKRSDYGLVWNKLVEGTSLVGDDVQIDLQIDAPAAKP